MVSLHTQSLAVALVFALAFELSCKSGDSATRDKIDLNGIDDATGGTPAGGSGKVVAGDPGPLIVAFGSVPKDARAGSVLVVSFFVTGELSSLGYALAESVDQITAFEALATDATAF